MGLLVEANDEEKRARDALTYSAWGKRLTEAQFLAREQALRSHPFAKQAMRTWLWKSGNRVLSSCETFEVPAVCEGRVGRAFILASVFTEAALRGQGHASGMMAALLGRQQNLPESIATVLFSEVGASLYQQAGFTVVESSDVVVRCDEFGSVAAAAIETTAGLARPPKPQGTLGVQLEVSLAQGEWHLERERFYSSVLGLPSPRAHSARVGASELSVVASYQSNELHVLWYRFAHETEGAPLLSWAVTEAQRCNLSLVRLWETEPISLPPGAIRLPRTDELPMIRAYRGVGAEWTNVARGLWA